MHQLRKRLPEPNASPIPEIVETSTTGDPLDAALRLGSAATGRALAYRAGPPSAFSAVASCEIRDTDGATVGALEAMDLTLRPLEPTELESFADAALLIGRHLDAEARLGRVDHVTLLPNRTSYERDHDRLVASAEQPCLVHATIAEAKHFSQILRALGHACAESFIRTSAAMIRASAPKGRPIYHVSVVSFVFMIDAEVEEPTEVARALVAAFERPVMCDGLPISTRLGVGLAPIEGPVRPAEALRSALAAAYHGRRNEVGYGFYDRKADENHLRSFRLMADLGSALSAYGELSLAFQPRIALAPGRTVGAEALIRWMHPALGSISPAEFVPLAETTGLIEPLTDLVLDRACRTAAEWKRRGLDLRLSVNVSLASLRRSDLAPRVAAAIERAGIDSGRLELEFTEDLLTASEAPVRATIDAIKQLGVAISIDDFGSGYSNLGYLTRIPADVLKIDRSFISGVETDERRARLVRLMIEMGHDLGFEVVAEGVETADVYAALRRWGCDEAQGFYMSRPISADALAEFATSFRGLTE